MVSFQVNAGSMAVDYQSLTRLEKPVKYMEIPDGDHVLAGVLERCAAEVVEWLGEIGIIGG